MQQFFSVRADIITFILIDYPLYGVVFTDIFYIRTGLSLFMILKLDITRDLILFLIQAEL